MKLWIRSQNKKQLVQAHNIYIDFNYDLMDSKRKIYMIMNDNEALGYFDNEANAFHVIDDIHQKLIDLQTLELYPESYKSIHRRLDCIYQIPEE